MQQLNSLIAAQLVVPGEDDWIVRFKLSDGSAVARRVSPGSLTAETAILKARCSLGPKGRQVTDVDCMRYADTLKLVVPISGGGA